MKKTRLAVLVLGVLLLGLTGIAAATTLSAGDYLRLTAYNGDDMAGVMTYAVSHDQGQTTAYSFQTFCIQDNVNISPGTWYTVAALSDTVGHFNQNLPGAGPLNGAVDYLFARYQAGAYAPTMTSPQRESDFQRLLWSLQGSGPAYTSSGYLWSDDFTAYSNTPAMHHSWGTVVINIANTALTWDVQNQLYNHPVPAPSTILLFGSGLVGLAGIRRKNTD